MIVIFKINKCKILTGGNYMFLIKKTFKTISTVNPLYSVTLPNSQICPLHPNSTK